MLNVEPLPLPTALLSTQTDGFTSFYIKDLSNSLLKIIDKLKKEKASIDCIYSGYLANSESIDKVKEIRKKFNNSLYILDPVLGDLGKYYQGFDSIIRDNMIELCYLSDIITPNYSEALFLSNIDYKENISLQDIKDIGFKLSNKYNSKVVITSIPLEDRLATIAFENNKTKVIEHISYKYNYPGCGDLFASILSSLIISSFSFFDSCSIATNLSSEALKRTINLKRERKMGVIVETIRKELVNLI